MEQLSRGEGEDPYIVPVNATFLGQSLRRIAWEYPDYCY